MQLNNRLDSGGRMIQFQRHIDVDNLWNIILGEAQAVVDETPLLRTFYDRNILQHASYNAALAHVLAEKMADKPENTAQWSECFFGLMAEHKSIALAASKDLLCQLQNNAAIKDHYTPLLYFGGYQALQCYRLAHVCWLNNQAAVANYIQSKVVSLYGVDIHPAAKIGAGIFMDHAVGIVIGETAVVEDDVTLFQNVTLGGTGKGSGDRHPKVRRGAFIGSGAQVFGNIEIGAYAKVAGGAVVVKAVAPGTTVVGPLAKPLG
jgi:serine O-acetyltransferase